MVPRPWPRIAAAPVLALSLIVASPAASGSPSDVMYSALLRLRDGMDIASRELGEDGAQALGQRLADDIENADGAAQRPPSFSAADWDERLRRVDELDSSIVAQVVSGRREPIAGQRGLVERIIVSRADGTWQPIALYVPATLSAKSSLVVLLHGRPQTESEILGMPFFRTLADATNAIVVAPWGRGNYDFFGAAADDMYQAADEVAHAYGVADQRRYLVGYSMGGFAVFKIGPRADRAWAAVMSISGSLLNSEAAGVRKAFQNTPVYIVNGKLDAEIPATYGEATARYLASAGIPTGFYQETTGTHMLPTLLPSLTRAWDDMIAGRVKRLLIPPGDAGVQIPSMMTDSSALKP